MELTLAQRRAVTKAQLAKWPKASRSEKSAILDVVTAVTGWHRDHARKVIRSLLAGGGEPVARQRRVPVRTYDEAADALLTRCWAILDGPAGKRLHAALPEVVANLERHGRLAAAPETVRQVLAMSAATIDRRLAPARQGLVAGKGMAHTRPGTMLKSSIPLKTWAEWNDAVAGFLQIDMVGHEGGDNNGEFHLSLNATDVATGWTETITVRSKGERIVAAGLDQLRLRFPFAVLGIHSDNGSEFINYHLRRWTELHRITFTRGRASHSNDQAHVEQKNWSIVRRNVGYYRYDTARELELLNQLWPLVSIQANLFLPQQRLVSKTRQGAKVTKKHDAPATPWARLLRRFPDSLDPHDQATVEALHHDTDVEALKHAIADLQGNLLHLARERGTVQRRARTHHVYRSRRKLDPPTRAKPDESTNQTKRAS